MLSRSSLSVGVTNVSDSGAYGGLLRPGLIDGASIDAGALTSSSAEIGDFFKLLKPGVMSLVVFTAFIGLALAPGDCHGFLFFVKLLSIAMASGGAAAFNMWYDRDIDAIMKRTMKRPIPAGRICPDDALAFSVVVSSMALLLMIFSGSIVGAGLLLFSILFYCVVYTIFLKRYTSQNIVIGGLAGALPPLIGWMSISCDDLFLPLWMTALIFIWTPSHFWALCLIRSDDYKAVGVPMLPVTHGAQYTIFQVMIYSISLFCLSLLPYYYDALSHFYFYCALFLGLIYVVLSVLIFSAYKSRVDKLNMRCGLLFAYSILYLFVLFAVIFFDRWYYFNEF